VEVAASLRDEEVISAEQIVRERSVELRRLAAFELGPDQLLLGPVDLPESSNSAPDAQAALVEALERNPQELAAGARRTRAGVELDVATNSVLPELDLTLAGGPIGVATSPREAFSDALAFHAFSASAGFTFQTPIPARGPRNQRVAATELARQAALDESEVALELRAAVLRLSSEVASAQRRRAVLANTADAARLDLEAEQARFVAGRATNFDVLRRQEGLALARGRQVGAQIDEVKARTQLFALTGQLFDEYGGAF
jgi:outer membrane protein TolC